MEKKSVKTWIAIAALVMAITGGYIGYRTFSPPIAHDDQWHPAGRVYTVQRSSMPIGVSGVGTVKRSSSPSLIAGVKEDDVKKIKAGNKARIWIKEMSSTVEGDVVSISDKPRTINNQTLYDVTVSLKNESNVKDGMSGDMQIVLDSKQNVIVIPALAVQTAKNGEKFVWVLPPNWEDKPGNKIKPITREVTIGYTDERNAEVTSGLQEGEKIVLPTNQE